MLYLSVCIYIYVCVYVFLHLCVCACMCVCGGACTGLCVHEGEREGDHVCALTCMSEMYVQLELLWRHPAML